MGEKATLDPWAVREQIVCVQSHSWAGSIRACFAKDMQRALDATLWALEAARLGRDETAISREAA